jgi:hypothetical protein
MRIIQFPASSLDLDAENYIQRVEVADGQALEDGLKTIISELFVSLKSFGRGANIAGKSCPLAPVSFGSDGTGDSIWLGRQQKKRLNWKRYE